MPDREITDTVAYLAHLRMEGKALQDTIEVGSILEVPMSDLARRLDSSLLWLVAAVTVIGLMAPASNGGQAAVDQHSPTVTTSSLVIGDSKKGEPLYQASCIVCHGPRAEGGIGPRLAGNPILSNDEAFWKIVHEGHHVMPPLKGAISDQQMADIRAWLKTVR